MDTWLLILILAGGLSVTLVIVVISTILHRRHLKKGVLTGDKALKRSSAEVVDGVDRVFNEEFREELRNHGRLYFDKIIGENAMFLQQDLQLTTSQLNEYMKQEISKKLQQEFGSYEQSMKDAQNLALETIQKTIEAAQNQREAIEKNLQATIDKQKAEIISRFENEMADIINHYLAEAFGSRLNLEDQLQFILGEMEANKEAMKKDMYA